MEIEKFLEELSEDELCYAYSQIITELKNRRIIHSKNVVGDLGEYFAIKHYCSTAGLPNLQRAPTGTQNVDALSRRGERYSIKSTTSNTTGVFYGLNDPESGLPDNQKFEFVIVVILDKNFKLIRINELTWEDFQRYKRWHSRMRAWNLGINRALLENTKSIYIASNGQ